MTERSKPVLMCCLGDSWVHFNWMPGLTSGFVLAVLRCCKDAFPNGRNPESLAAARLCAGRSLLLLPGRIYVKVTLGTLSISGW